MKLAMLAFFASLVVAAAAPAYEPTSNYTIKNVEGWKVYVNNGLLGKSKHADVGSKVLKKLKEDLADVKARVPDRPLKELLKVPIWLEVDTTNGPHGRTPTFHYHPGKGWLKKMDFNPEKHQCVEFSRAAAYAGRGKSSVVLHELAHGYHDRVLGFDDARILAAYKKAVAGKAYPPRDWARSDHKEFFCAVTQRYFGRKAERDRLKKQDPGIVKILKQVWGEPKSYPDDPPAKEPKKKRTFEPTSNYTIKNIEGWRVYVNNRLLGEEKKVGAAALKLLQSKFYDIVRAVPQRAVKEMRKTAVWLEMDNDWHTPCACYHGSEKWLRDNGLNPHKAKSVEIANAGRFLRWSHSQPSMVLHEMTHAYQDRVLRHDAKLFARLKEAYGQAVKGKKYDSVMRYHGRQHRHYAINNVAEYFAESTEAYFGVNDYYPFVRAELMHHDPAAYRLMKEIWKPGPQEPLGYRKNELKVTDIPKALRDSLGLDAFYKKHVSARGLPVVASRKVSDYALLEAAYLINHMLQDRPRVRNALIEQKVRFVVMGVTEMTTAIPEYRSMKPSKFWDRRARGLGPSRERLAVSCGEENLLRYPGDPYHEESILVHEFAHAVHVGIRSVDKSFDGKLKTLYEKAMKKGLWKGKYGANNPSEYWAEGVQSWFDTNRLPDHDHNHVNTREELREYDGDLAELIAGEFRNSEWRYRRPDDRKYAGHLAAYDPKKAPRFAWPPGIDRWYKQYLRKQKAAKKDAAKDKGTAAKDPKRNLQPAK